ncbi:hypothetical protein [Marinobacter caseinilyticus]|uniref:hypothetical protein n=1 Tax=Marinobacter caseinilyticus TaxID=2692195 RepID=UPI0014092A32|nr:hypothetical protein [Marinobacter caseinilyticus]
MARSMCQQTLDRVIAYLRGYGIEPSNYACRRALKVVDAALADGSEGAMARVIDRVPEFFELPEPHVPRQRPELKRGSIGYRRYV